MISRVMNFCNNHFPRTCERSNSFAIAPDGITGNFTKTYIVGQYIWIKETIANDGVYKIKDVSTTKLTLDAVLATENTGDFITLYGLAVPRNFLDIVNDINDWASENAGKEGIQSEKIDDYSVTYSGSGGIWESAFVSRLRPYRQVYETPELPLKNGVTQWR